MRGAVPAWEPGVNRLAAALRPRACLDVTVVTVALPAIGADLSLSESGSHWLISAYALTFSGLLLVAGRAGDLLGRRRIFLAGTALFGVSSLFCGLAWSQEALVAGRIGQGLGSALASPTAFAILTAAFAEGAGRTRALGVWGSTNGAGAAAGALVGGALTETVPDRVSIVRSSAPSLLNRTTVMKAAARW